MQMRWIVVKCRYSISVIGGYLLPSFLRVVKFVRVVIMNLSVDVGENRM